MSDSNTQKDLSVKDKRRIPRRIENDASAEDWRSLRIASGTYNLSASTPKPVRDILLRAQTSNALYRPPNQVHQRARSLPAPRLHPVESDKQYTAAVNFLKHRQVLPDHVLKCEDPELELKSAMGRKPHSSRIIKVWIWIIRITPIVALLVMMGYFMTLVINRDNWETDPNSEDETKLKRTSNRGIVMSIISSLIITFCGGYLFHIGVPEGMVITNFGFVLAPVIAYILDVGVATDEGWVNFFVWDGFTYAFKSLTQDNFARFVVTFFLDLFISNPLQDVLKRQARASGIMDMLTASKHPNRCLQKWDGILALNFPAILQAMVGFITFNAYTNQTRFAWAYPAKSVDRDLRIPPGAIMLSTAIASVLYLNFYTLMDIVSQRNYYKINTKLSYVIVIMMILYILNWQEAIEAPVEGEENTEMLEWMGESRPAVGLGIFVFFLFYGFIYPVYTQLGCCGYGKPKPRPTVNLAVVEMSMNRKQSQLAPGHRNPDEYDGNDTEVTSLMRYSDINSKIASILGSAAKTPAVEHSRSPPEEIDLSIASTPEVELSYDFGRVKRYVDREDSQRDSIGKADDGKKSESEKRDNTGSRD